MGLFGSIGKLLGGVAKAGLSVATRGVSDKVLSALKGMGKKRSSTALKPQLWTEQQAALVNKMGQAVPRVRRTEVMADAVSGDALPGYYKRKSSYKRKRASTRRAATSAPEPATPRRSAPRRTRRTTAGGKRQPPPGGLDLRAMAAQWRSAGKPGRWIDWIRSNPIRRA